VILAAAGEVVPDMSSFAQWGPFGGIVSVVVAFAWVLFKALMKTLDVERARADRLESDCRELNRAIHEKYIPATTSMLAEATRLAQVTAETTRVLQDRRGDR
jgi:hypothetical protein